MSEPQRFEAIFKNHDDGSATLEVICADEGQWILYKDHLARVESLEGMVRSLTAEDRVVQLAREKNVLVAKVEELERRIETDWIPHDRGMVERADKFQVESERLRKSVEAVRNRLAFLLADVERCGSFETLTERELPNLHDALARALGEEIR
jgi:hypothetical protein